MKEENVCNIQHNTPFFTKSMSENASIDSYIVNSSMCEKQKLLYTGSLQRSPTIHFKAQDFLFLFHRSYPIYAPVVFQECSQFDYL